MRGHTTLAVVLAGGALLLTPGCPGDAGGGGKVSTRDSAGISIVENSGPSWPANQGWTVVDSPIVDIGDVDRVVGPVRLNDGRIALGNGGTHEVRVYDAKGALLKSSGRTGSGPGEFQNLVGIWAGPGDSIMVSDVLLRRQSILDREGTFARSLSLGGGSGGFVSAGGQVDFAVPLGWLGDGSIVGLSQTFAINAVREGTFRDTVRAIVYGPDGTTRDTVGGFPGPEMETMTLNIGTQPMSAPFPVPLGRQFVSAARGERLYVGINNAWEIEARGLDGSHKMLIRSAEKPVPITPGDVAANREELRDQMSSQPMMRNVPEPIKKQLTARVDQARYPATFAFFAALLVDTEGNVWAQEASASSETAQRFAVIDASGKFLGRVTMPTRFRTSFIGPDVVYGVWKDPDDIEHVRAYPLRKGAGDQG